MNYEALMCLRYVLPKYPSRSPVLCPVGAAGAAYSVYNTLDLKSIQLDTLSYVCSRHVAAQGQLAAAQLVFNTVLKFFNNVKDVSCAGEGH